MALDGLCLGALQRRKRYWTGRLSVHRMDGARRQNCSYAGLQRARSFRNVLFRGRMDMGFLSDGLHSIADHIYLLFQKKNCKIVDVATEQITL